MMYSWKFIQHKSKVWKVEDYDFYLYYTKAAINVSDEFYFVAFIFFEDYIYFLCKRNFILRCHFHDFSAYFMKIIPTIKWTSKKCCFAKLNLKTIFCEFMKSSYNLTRKFYVTNVVLWNHTIGEEIIWSSLFKRLQLKSMYEGAKGPKNNLNLFLKTCIFFKLFFFIKQS